LRHIRRSVLPSTTSSYVPIGARVAALAWRDSVRAFGAQMSSADRQIWHEYARADSSPSTTPIAGYGRGRGVGVDVVMARVCHEICGTRTVDPARR
jgi:hypothetical protein